MTKLIALFLVFFSLTEVSAAVECRNPAVKHKFDKQQGYPKGRPGYIVDHICALSCGGLDIVENMQYQTVKDSKVKDRWEGTREGCAKTCTPTNSKPVRTVFNCK